MRKKLILSALLVLILTSILAVNAYASSTYTYTDNIGSGTASTLLTEKNFNTKTWTFYPSLTLNDSGSLTVSGTGVSVNYSNYSSYAGYFYQDESGNVYQFSHCIYATPSSGTKVPGGAISKSSQVEGIPDTDCFKGFYSSVKVVAGQVVCEKSKSGVAGDYMSYNYSGPEVYQYNGENWSHSMGAHGYYGYKITCAGDDTYAWNFRAVPTYKVTFDPQSGTVSPATSTVIYNRPYGTLPTPTRTGYTFQGWYTGIGGTGSRILSTYTVGITSNTTVYALWSVNTYTVNFDPQSGSVTPTSLIVNYGSTYGTLPTPTRTGYTFNGWYTGMGGSGTKIISTSQVLITSNTTLYASWTASKYTVTFDPQSGTVSPSSMTVTYGSTYVALPAPSREGYTFIGWFTGTGGGGTQINNTDTVSITSDITLYAAWKINQYTVTFQSNGGSSVASIKQDNYTAVDKPADPTKTGYTFTGWYTDSILSNAVTWPITLNGNDITLYAAWTINQYTVSFNSNGGSSVVLVKQDYNTTVAKPTDPTRTGYTFAGWYADSTLTSAVTWPLTIGANDITLYAAWTINQYTVNFQSNGGSSVPPIKQDYNSIVAEPESPTLTGYSFVGWYSDSALTSAVTWPLTIGANDITLYAAWKINQYTVSFESNGGGSVAFVKQDYNTTVAKPEAPARTGYTFAGWFADSSLTSAVSWPLTIGAGDVTLYAAWTINQYTVSFDSNGGSSVASVKQDYNTTVAEPAVPTRTGYSFAGWYMDSALTSTVTWPLTIGAGDVTLYANWLANPYTVSFESNDGSSVASITQDYGTTVAEPKPPMRSGYAFTGWYTDSALTSAVTWPLTIGAGDITLYAKWSANPYTVSFVSNDGSAVESITQDCGKTVAEPKPPTRSGYAFAGWYMDSALKNAVTWPLTIGADNITLYAKWTENTGSVITWTPNYTVSFDTNGGGTVINKTISSGGQISAPPEPTRPGYTFEGWYKDSACTIPWDFSEKVTGSVTLFAKWSAESSLESYTVTFESNGGNAVSAQKVSEGSTVVPVSEPIKSGYAFAGWYKDASMTMLWNFSSDVVTDNMTLYAKWVVEENDDNKPKSKKGSDNPTAIVSSSTDNGDDGTNDHPDSHGGRDPGEMEISSYEHGNKDTESEIVTEDGKADAISWSELLQYAGPIAAAVLVLLLLALLLVLTIRNMRRKRVEFFDNSGEICKAAIRRNRVDITKAISQASGKLLKVKISDWYMEKAYGSELEFCYNGAPIGTVTIEDEESFEINIR